MLIHPLDYSADSAALFACIAKLPWAVFLDSGQPGSQYGRYDIMAASPFIRLTVQGEHTQIDDATGTRATEQDPFAVLKQLLGQYRIHASLPFEGGAIGYFGYDLGRRLEVLPQHAEDAEQIPQMMVGIYDWAVIVDHRDKRALLVSHAQDAQTTADWPALCELLSQPCQAPGHGQDFAQNLAQDFALKSPVVSNMDEAAYGNAFEKIKRYILEGDCYQVNLAQRFSAQAQGDAWAAYLHLRNISPAPFMAFMNLPQLQILSGSPERFLQVKSGHVETRPIKGTRPRSADEVEDAQHAADLESSLKDRAENVMIVDLLRNDIGKSCAVGSVRADRLFALESFANVHHLVSTVIGHLAPGMVAIDLFRGCFPGGSITGAPKLRAMQIIEELEPHRRGVYCGAIAYIGFDGNMDSNIAIRTAVYSGNEIRFWAGGGIVADSEMHKEYRETWDKASSMLQLMEYFSHVTENE